MPDFIQVHGKSVAVINHETSEYTVVYESESLGFEVDMKVLVNRGEEVSFPFTLVFKDEHMRDQMIQFGRHAFAAVSTVMIAALQDFKEATPPDMSGDMPMTSAKPITYPTAKTQASSQCGDGK